MNTTHMTNEEIAEKTKQQKVIINLARAMHAANLTRHWAGSDEIYGVCREALAKALRAYFHGKRNKANDAMYDMDRSGEIFGVEVQNG